MEYPTILDIRDLCTGCGACVESCKKGCVDLTQNEHGFYYPVVEMSECVMCGTCSKACHVLSGSNRFDVPEWWNKSCLWAYQSKKKEIVEQSTSGGAFTLFSSWCLNQGGVVFASRYNGLTERLEFSDTDRFPLSEFRKSRYMESYTNRVYSQIRQFLREDRYVMFCGSPCQVAGLRSFLGKINTEKLLILNFICHGVPSNKYFHQWLHKKYPDIGFVENVDFRYKNFQENKGWHDMYLYIKTNKSIVIPYTYSSYYLSFLQNDLLRKCCYNCHIINEQNADVTIGDYWGVTKGNSIKDENVGLSLVILHSKKAQQIFEGMAKESFSRQLSYNDVEYAFHSHVYSLKNRENFEAQIRKYGFVQSLDRKYRLKILKYRIQRLLRIQKIYKWLKR